MAETGIKALLRLRDTSNNRVRQYRGPKPRPDNSGVTITKAAAISDIKVSGTKSKAELAK